MPLTDTGTKSADDLCDYFKEKQIKHVYVSDLLRTQQTFEHIFHMTLHQRLRLY